MDNFYEQLVVKNETSGDKARRIGTVISGSLFTLCLVLIAMLQMDRPIMALLGLLLAVGAGYGTYFLVTTSYVEYEYAFTNGELDVDKIIAKKKRSSLVSINVSSFSVSVRVILMNILLSPARSSPSPDLSLVT